MKLVFLFVRLVFIFHFTVLTMVLYTIPKTLRTSLCLRSHLPLLCGNNKVVTFPRLFHHLPIDSSSITPVRYKFGVSSSSVMQKSHPFTSTPLRLYSSHESDEEIEKKVEDDKGSAPAEFGTEKLFSSDSDSDSEAPSVEDDGPDMLTPEDIQTLTNGDSKLENKIKFIQMEMELMRQAGHRVPVNVTMKFWPELLALSSKGQRAKFYSYLWNNEISRINRKRKKEERMQKRLEEFATNPIPLPAEDPYYMFYGMNRNTIFLRLYDQKVATFQHHRVISEMTLGASPLVIDMGYDDQMQFREAKNCASQLELALTANRSHAQPFNLSLCNANPESNTMTCLKRRIPTLCDDNYALNITETSYLELYPREKLVYLSPHARDEIADFNHDEIYVIGAIVDKSDPRPFSVAKAKKEGLRMKKLPLDTYIDWGIGGKSLTINQIISIMLEIRATGDWKKALRFVPRRKLIGGRRECPLPEPGQQPGPRPFQRRQQSQVFKDFELVAQRRRGFVYQGRDDDGNITNPRVYQPPHDEGNQGGKPNYTKQNLRSIMSDSD